SIVDLGLIYGVEIEDGVADIEMTLTYTGCPARNMLINEVKQSVGAVEGIESVDVTIVWSPGWTVDMVTRQGEKSLREFGLSV
ncbi:MAG: metal-sulfur cluster biosynthetic enzyme, partial [Natronomonas sp.]